MARITSNTNVTPTKNGWVFREDIADFTIFEGFGCIDHIRAVVEICSEQEGDWHVIDLEGENLRGAFITFPDSPFKSFIMDELNRNQRSLIDEAANEVRFEVYGPDADADEDDDPKYYSMGWGNPLSPQVL